MREAHSVITQLAKKASADMKSRSASHRKEAKAGITQTLSGCGHSLFFATSLMHVSLQLFTSFQGQLEKGTETARLQEGSGLTFLALNCLLLLRRTG